MKPQQRFGFSTKGTTSSRGNVACFLHDIAIRNCKFGVKQQLLNHVENSRNNARLTLKQHPMIKEA